MTVQGDSHRAAALDAAFGEVAVLDFEIPNKFVNHGPMACEALDALGLGRDLEPWVHSFLATVPSTARPVPSELDSNFVWETALGDYRELPHWIAFFESTIRDQGWKETVSTWGPRLVPGLASALFHGVIRTAHAVRAIDSVDTPARREELARALAHWAIWFEAGEDIDGIVEVGDLSAAVVEFAANGASCYATDPNAFTLHGVTGAMAMEILMPHLSPDCGFARRSSPPFRTSIALRGRGASKGRAWRWSHLERRRRRSGRSQLGSASGQARRSVQEGVSNKW